MGNKSCRETAISNQVNNSVNRGICLQKFISDRNNSLRSFLSIESEQSTCSVSRPWSRVSRKRWRKSTLTLPYQACKTAWPVSQLETFFLPAFPVEHLHKDNNFEKLSQISRGAFGNIYRILDLEKNEIFALKVLSKSKIIESNLIKQVIEEVQIHRACGHHPFIVKCSANWQSRKHLYIATEYIEGGELWGLLDKIGALALDVVQLYVAQIALALDFLHNAGVIHRDLKPENILLDSDANIKLTDFGLSKWLPFGETTRTVCGTPKYMAPEILRMEPYGHSVDWWSLGIVACLMLTSKIPTLDIQPHSEHPNGKIDLPAEFLDLPSRDLLRRLLEIQSNQRLRSLRTLTTIAFYKGYNFEDVKKKKLKAKELLTSHHGDDYEKDNSQIVSFDGFDEILISE